MKKELGGQRLGNENKELEVEIKEYDSSNQDLSFIVRTTMSAGTVVPTFVKVALPGDFWRIRIQMDVKTKPTEGPLFGSYKAETQMFKFAWRLYNPDMMMDAVDIGLNMAEVKIPQITFKATNTTTSANYDNSQTNPSCVMRYLGITGFGRTATEQTRDFNALTILGLWDTYKNYLANKQERLGAVIHTPTEDLVDTINTMSAGTYADPTIFAIEEAPTVSTPNGLTVGSFIAINYTGASPLGNQIIINIQESGLVPLSQMATLYTDNATTQYWEITNMYGGTNIVNWSYVSVTNPAQLEPKVVTFPLENIDTMRRAIFATAGTAGQTFFLNDEDITPYKWLWDESVEIPNLLSSQEGLPVKTYMSDLFNNWLNTAWISGAGGINIITAIDTTGNSFQIPQLLLKKKIYDMMNNVVVSGGSADDWQEANWGKKPRARATKPEYEGGLIKEIVFQEVVSNTQTEDQPLGTLAGKGVMGNKHVGGYVECEIDELSYIMGLTMITPRVDYSQGNEWDIHLKTWDDPHKPPMDGIGFQDLIQERMHWSTTVGDGTNWLQKSAGKQPAWMEYRTSVNKCFGNFAIENSEQWMTLQRKYTLNENKDEIDDMTTYIDPVKYNSIFSVTAIDAQNFWVQIGYDVEVTRKMSNRVMPIL